MHQKDQKALSWEKQGGKNFPKSSLNQDIKDQKKKKIWKKEKKEKEKKKKKEDKEKEKKRKPAKLKTQKGGLGKS